MKDYNYRGALTTLDESNLLTNLVRALLNYGYYRSARDFNQADSCLNAVRAEIEPHWIQEMALLRQKDSKARLLEAYFSAQVCLNNQQYANFLINVFSLQESLLQFLVWRSVGLHLTGERSQAEQNWTQIEQVDQGRLYAYLQSYRLPKGDSLRLGESISRYVMIAILDYSPQMVEVIPFVKYLNEYCDLRNRSVHEFASVSEIQDEAKLLATLKSLMRRTVGLPDANPFDCLNQQICELLDRSLRLASTAG